MEPRVTDNPEASRYEIWLGEERVGFSEYRLAESRITLAHTEIEPGHRRRGLAGWLTRSVLEGARRDGVAVLPQCGYVRWYIREHPKFLGLVPKDRRAHFDLPQE